MSADDFQTKFSSVAESMLKAAIAETTKLFETMVDELKAEISKIKKENEDLKIRCSQFENARSQAAVYSRESEPVAGPSAGCGKRDRGVQCDLVPVRTVLVEQCEPLRHSSQEEMGYILQEHNYGEGTTQMAFVLEVKQEEDCYASFPQSVLKQEEVEPTVICGLVSSDEAGSPRASACGTENKGLPNNQECSTGARPSPQQSEETQVAQNKLTSEEPPNAVAQQQSEVESRGKRSLVSPQCQREGKTSVNIQADTEEHLAQPTPLNEGHVSEELKRGVAEGEAVPQPEGPVRRKRGRPPKKSKLLQEPVKEIPSPAGSRASLRRCSSEKEKRAASKQLTVEMEEGAVQTPSTELSCAAETLNTSTVQPRERRTSVTLQDAILLVEAMNQSTVENTCSSPQRMVARPQTQCAPCIDILPTVEEAPAEPETSLLPLETPKAAGNLPVTELSTTTQSTTEIPKQQHTVTTSSTTKYSMPSSIAAVKTSVRSLQQHPPHPLKKSVAPRKPVEAVSHKLIVMPKSLSSFIPPKIAPLSPSQLPTVLSTVVAAQKKSILSGSTSADLPLRTPSRSSVPQKTIDAMSRKPLPIVTSQSTATATDAQSGTLPHSKITIIIPRQVSAVASRKHQSQTIALPSLPQLISSSQEISVSVDTQTTSCEVFTILPQKTENMLDNLESPKQTGCLSENPTEMGLASLVSPAAPSFVEQTLTPVVKLTRIPFPVAANEAVLVPRSPTDGSSETQSVLIDDTTEEKPSSGIISTQPSETLVLSTDICSNLKENLVALSVHTSQTSEQNDTQEKVPLSSEKSTILDKSLDSGPLTPPKVLAPAFENSEIAISTLSGTAGEPTLYLDEEVIHIGAQNCALPNDTPVEEKRSAAVIHLTSITNKDTSDPPSRFLAKLAVSPVTQDLEKASNLSVDTQASCAETSISIKKRLPKNSLMAQLRSHLKTHSQARRTESNPEPCTETETCTVNSKKPRLEKDSSKDKTREPIPVSPQTPGAVKDVTSPGKTTIDATLISPRRFGLSKQGVRPKRTVREPTSVSPRRFSSTKESTSPRIKKSTSLSPRRSSSTKQSASAKNTKSTSVNPRMSCSPKERASPKNTKMTSVSPKRSSSTRESARNKNMSARSRRTSLSRDGATPKKAKSTVSPIKSSKNGTSPKLSAKESTPFCRRRCTITKNDSSTKQIKSGPNSSGPRYSITTHGASPKNTKSVSPKSMTLSKSDASPKLPTNESTPFCRRRCTFTNSDPSSEEIKEESNSPSPRYSITTDVTSPKNTKRETSSSSVWWPQLANDGDSPTKTGESTPAKQSRFTQHGTGLQRTVRVVDATKLANAAKDKTTAKMKNSSQSKLTNIAKTSQLAENRASCEAVRKLTAKTVLTRSQDNTIVHSSSVPVVSPLQPLSVIGRRLLKNQCGECGRVLSSTAALESHVSLHSGRRPFSCTLCGKSFADAKGLKRHGRVHRNGRIHICQQCGKGFVYSFGLTKHLRMVHRKLKPFICQICNKGFYSKRDVEAHIRIHTGEKPFHCNLCEKKFARRVELNVHYRWHNGEKRHWCPFCGKGFLDFNNLKRHKYIHTGEKPHSCPHCPKNFTQSGHLKKHVKNVHKMT